MAGGAKGAHPRVIGFPQLLATPPDSLRRHSPFAARNARHAEGRSGGAPQAARDIAVTVTKTKEARGPRTGVPPQRRECADPPSDP